MLCPTFDQTAVSLCRRAIFVCLVFLPSLLFAQVPFPKQKTPPDSVRIVAADSTRVVNPPDSSRRVISAENLPDSSAIAIFAPPVVGFRMNKTAISNHLFQDFIQLASQTMPVISILAGEVGQPRYLGTGDLPARAVQMVVDEVWWIPGTYGTVDLTGLPDATLALLEEGGRLGPNLPHAASPYSIHFASDSLQYDVPFSRIEYAKGPFGADAVRIRFGRALSQRLTTYLNGTLSNADGQFANLPYDGHKVSGQLDYFLTSKWRLHYRHLNSRNEVGVAVPFFPEEWPGLSRAFHKEERLYHALELSSLNKFRVRGFIWQIKEELNDPVRSNRHRLRDGGLEIRWQKQTARWAVTLQNRLGLEQIKSWTIENRDRIYDQFNAMLGWRLGPKMWIQVAGDFAYKDDWPHGLALQAKLIAQPTGTLAWWLAGGVWKIPPALSERDNTVRNDTLVYLSRNDDLQTVNLRRGEIGFHWQRPRFDLKLRLSGSVWQNGLVFRVDSLTNSGSLNHSQPSKFVLGTQLSLHWEFIPQWHFYAISAQTLNPLPRQFWFWHQPQGYSRVSLETIKSFFDGDLEILPRVAGRFIGKRYSPSFAADEVELLSHELPAVAVLDLQIRLRHGDGALLFSWENVLNQQFEWRHGVPAVGRFLRWGFWWNFLN